MAQDRRVNSKNFFGELKRRNVYKVAVAYIVAGWALAQGLAQVLPVFSVPTWTHALLEPAPRRSALRANHRLPRAGFATLDR